MSILGRKLTVAILFRTGFVVVLVLVDVPGFRPVLARGWHEGRVSMRTIGNQVDGGRLRK
jgi:hypothetical protein